MCIFKVKNFKYNLNILQEPRKIFESSKLLSYQDSTVYYNMFQQLVITTRLANNNTCAVYCCCRFLKFDDNKERSPPLSRNSMSAYFINAWWGIASGLPLTESHTFWWQTRLAVGRGRRNLFGDNEYFACK